MFLFPLKKLARKGLIITGLANHLSPVYFYAVIQIDDNLSSIESLL